MIELRAPSLALLLAGCQLVSGVDELVIRGAGGSGASAQGGNGTGAGEEVGGTTNAGAAGPGGSGGSGGGVPCANGNGTQCGDECITDLPSNPLHCGGCNVACDAGESCATSHCVLTVDYAGYSSPKELVVTSSEAFFTAHGPATLSGKDALVHVGLAGEGPAVLLDNLDQANGLIAAAGGVVVSEGGGMGRVQHCTSTCAAVFTPSPQVRFAALDPVMGATFYYVRADRGVGVHDVPGGGGNLYNNNVSASNSLPNTFSNVAGIALTDDGVFETPTDDKPDALAVIGNGLFGLCRLAHTQSEVQCLPALTATGAADLVYRPRRAGPEASVLVATATDGVIWSTPVSMSPSLSSLASGLNGVRLLGLDASGAYEDDILFWANDTELRGCAIGAGFCQTFDLSTELVDPVALAVTPTHVYVLGGNAGKAILTRVRR